MRTALRITGVLATAKVVALVLYLFVCAVSLVWSGSHDNGATADVIVVMGAAQYDGTPSPLLARRLQHALDLWRDGRSPLIAVTGGKKKGDRFTEAASSRRWLVDRGVPGSSILSEDQGTSTWESLRGLAPVLRRADVHSAIAVTSPWHEERVVVSLAELGFSASASAARGDDGANRGIGWIAEPGAGLRTLKETLGVSVGRLIGFGRLFTLTG